MPNDPEIPEELLHLLEKRDNPERRKENRRKNETKLPKSMERRSGNRRVKLRRKK
ncbi:hypothetical protein RMSM_01622 [Rhodopirellula maiorica SM1]|uniref:Uncharacterized protein n=2 Tax=Novipirellula TaxID=2795426 RepID=M5RQ62_9BACT|nr:hypothetical protein [Rhodopirellula maiorica]EMI21478.1 hypothetical protein RMSM_01622 [Rhodopirellula maiorica SM1]|tara:strand:+ start:13194 stop:13358 length:165 start_codon:yes stop_codon:yes gene_type:complete